MKLVKPHLPAITHDLSLEFEGEDPHPRITHDMEFDITPTTLELNRGKEPSGPVRRTNILMPSGSSMRRSFAEVLGLVLIQKPHGEPGRPNSGGYNIEQKLNWTKESYKKFEDFIHNQCERHLDESEPLSRQDAKALESVYKLIRDEFPILQKYEEMWPARAVIKLRLKARSETLKRTKASKAIGDLAKTRGGERRRVSFRDIPRDSSA